MEFNAHYFVRKRTLMTDVGEVSGNERYMDFILSSKRLRALTGLEEVEVPSISPQYHVSSTPHLADLEVPHSIRSIPSSSSDTVCV